MFKPFHYHDFTKTREVFMNLFDKAKMLLKNLIANGKNDDCTCHTGKCSCEDKKKEEQVNRK